MLSVIYAGGHLCWGSFMLSATYAKCHLMLSVIYAECHISALCAECHYAECRGENCKL
jgi:hypothetical protein